MFSVEVACLGCFANSQAGSHLHFVMLSGSHGLMSCH